MWFRVLSARRCRGCFPLPHCLGPSPAKAREESARVEALPLGSGVGEGGDFGGEVAGFFFHAFAQGEAGEADDGHG